MALMKELFGTDGGLLSLATIGFISLLLRSASA